jgi:16S rRNA (guanine527-N7)-methyltransferase
VLCRRRRRDPLKAVSDASPADWRDLGQWSTKRGLTLSATQIDQLRAYLDVLLFWNRKLALVSQSDPRQIIDKHLADSLFAASYCVDGEPVVDLGSGAGFPGVVVAIARPASTVCLVESRGKKVSFLEQARRATGALNLSVCNARIETVSVDPEHRTRYAVATARALANTNKLLQLAAPLLAAGGRVIALRAVNEDPNSAPSAAEIVPYDLPDGTPRCLLIVRR